MNQIMSLNTPMQSIFLTSNNSFVKQSLFVLFGVVILALASQLSIPLLPVPLTFQSATVVLIGMAYGPKYGTYVVATYLLAGILGLPVFADFSMGWTILTGPTMGYLIGFLPAAWLSGYLAQKGFAKSIAKSFLAACLGVSVIFFLGVTVLAQSIGLKSAILFGLLPFLFSEVIKLLAVACLIPRLWKSS